MICHPRSVSAGINIFLRAFSDGNELRIIIYRDHHTVPRLTIQSDGKVTLYDSGVQQISGVAQQQAAARAAILSHSPARRAMSKLAIWTRLIRAAPHCPALAGVHILI
jgi:hypothetical protein